MKHYFFLFLQTLYGDIDSAYPLMKNYYGVWGKYGASPEFFNINHGSAVNGREGYPLRPGKVLISNIKMFI